MESLGSRLKNFRLLRRLSVAEVARALKVAETTYRDWEKGGAIRGEPYSQLAMIFNTSLSVLMLGNGEDRLEIEKDLVLIEAIIARIKSKL